MSRARATALALVNWKGVFYERYQLDRRVTALEGANGAGKTTVMIAAYIVLLPDMTRLRFTNLGETAAIGGDRGIWGRLGEPSRPSYAALELDLGAGQRVVAGVLLTRKAEPTVELTPFLIRQLAPGVRLQDLLLVVTAEEEAVPELAELKKNVAAASASLEVFASAKDYFAALFELGIGALRLASDEDRGRLGDMLRTSMTGGISRAITSELRSFLLREQSHIGDTLGRMRQNLEACRRTRIEVAEAQLLEQEISGVYDAGQGMFAAALQAARQYAQEQRGGLAQLGRARVEARRALDESLRAENRLAEQEAQLEQRLRQQRAELEQLREQGRLIATAAQLRGKRQELEAERQLAEQQLMAPRAKRTQAAQAREAAKRQREQALVAQERAALGLSDLQSGLDELHRRSGAYRNARRLQALVAELSGEAPPAPDTVAARLSDAEQALSSLDAERLGHERLLSLGQRHRQEHARALELLRLLGREAEVEGAYAEARGLLAELDALAAQVDSHAELATRASEHERLAERQHAARAAARDLGLSLEGRDSLQLIEAGLAAAELEASRLQEERQRLEEELSRTLAARAETQRLAEQARAALGKHRRLLQRVERVSAVAGGFEPTREGVVSLRDALGAERRELSTQLAQATERREQLLREANLLESAGGSFPEELLRLRDELDGELLGNRFEELDLEEAARLEALLGPLAQAIVVDDVQAASVRLRDKPRELPELRLIAVGTELPVLGRDHVGAGQDLCIDEGTALRITRLPRRPSLGRKAREARTHELRSQAEAVGVELEQWQARASSVSAAHQELDAILREVELLERGDPAEAEAEQQVRDAQLELQETELRQRLQTLELGLGASRAQAARYRGLLSEAFLLDAEDHSQKAAELGRERARLERAAADLQRWQAPRHELEQLLDALRVPPPSSAELERAQQQRQRLALERDRAFRLTEALRELSEQLPALAWQDAEQSLSESQRVAPALEQQLQRARDAVEEAERAVQQAESAWEEATSELQQAEAGLSALVAHAERLEQEARSLGSAAEVTPEGAERKLSQLQREAERLSLEERDLLSRRGAQAERVRQLGHDLAELERELEQAQLSTEPAEARWQALREQARSHDLLQSGEASEHDERRSSFALSAEARSRAELLRDRLAASRGGEALAQELAAFSPEEDDGFLGLWLRVREWLSRRVPAQVAQVDDPLLALERLRGHLSLLERRLSHQEADLRGSSEDIARGIEVQLRRAKMQVRRINQSLDGVSFGSIAGIRVELRRAASMEPVLRALAEGSAQELLFQSQLPTEEALSELLKRYGGGRGGGARVLDYREYLELVVEVQRKTSEDWEPANPTRLSTGEAIGVGAALMMVVLAEWERDANLLRARRGPGSLRFLFLDEANRLSQDNLGSLFDLCENLDLQLLIAAPEVARSEGNTTYRLVRKVSEDGREEVVVSGRRALAPEPEPELPAATPSAAPAPAQASLFEA